jgi:hypothetical protein
VCNRYSKDLNGFIFTFLMFIKLKKHYFLTGNGSCGYNVPIKQDKNFEKLNEPDIIKNSKLSGKKVHKNG